MNPRIIINYGLLTAGECLSKAFTFFAFAYIGRVMGPERYGSLEFTLAVMIFFTLPVDFGLGSYGARELARDRSRAPVLLREITLLRGAMAALSFAALVVFVVLLPKSADAKLMLLMYGFGLFGAPWLLQWFFQGHERMRSVAAVSVVRQGVFALLTWLFVRPGLPLPWLGAFELLSIGAAGSAGFYLLRGDRRSRLPRPRLQFAALLQHFRSAAPIGLAELAWAFLSYFPTVLLGFTVADGRELGWFAASHRLLMALHTFVYLYFFNLLPSFARCVPEPKERLRELIGGSLRVTVPAAILGGLLLTALSGQVVQLVYGEGFAGAGPFLAVLIWVIPAAMISGHYRYALLAYNLQTRLLYITAASALVSVLVGLATVRDFGAIAGAGALLAGHVVSMVLSYRCVRRRIADVSLPPRMAGQLVAAALFLGFFALFARTGVWMAAFISALAYVSSLAATQLRSWRTG